MQQRKLLVSSPFALRKASALASSRRSVPNAPSRAKPCTGAVSPPAFASAGDAESRKNAGRENAGVKCLSLASPASEIDR